MRYKSTADLVKELNKCGAKFNASGHRDEIFTLSNNHHRTSITINCPPTTDVDITTDKKFKQATICIKEEARVLEQTLTREKITDITPRMALRRKKFVTQIEYFINTLQQDYSYEDTDFNIDDDDVEKCTATVKITDDLNQLFDNHKNRNTIKVNYTVTIKVTLKASTNYFLVGIDETAHFISQLRKKPKSVKDAHKLLLPKGVPAGSPRQGEYFFVKATDKEIQTIFKDISHEIIQYTQLDNSTHYASCGIYSDKSLELYVMGIIQCERKNTHKDLYLTSLHRVVRNNEIPNDEDKNYD